MSLRSTYPQISIPLHRWALPRGHCRPLSQVRGVRGVDCSREGERVSRTYRYDLNASKLQRGDLQLEVREVGIAFGGLQALESVSLAGRQGDIHALIGPNGAGKTSLLNCVSGLYRPQSGSIVLHDGVPAHELTHLRPSAIAALGVARSFQNIELFKHMTVLDNLMLGRHVHMKQRVLASLVFFGPARRQEIEHRELVEEVVDLLAVEAVRRRTDRKS